MNAILDTLKRFGFEEPEYKIQYQPRQGWHIMKRVGKRWVTYYGAYWSREAAERDLRRITNKYDYW